MNNRQEYIISQLESLYSKFENLKIRYEFNKILNTHLIEILPLEAFESQEYILEEMSITDDFEELFGFDEEILFISEDSLNKIQHPSFELGYNQPETFRFDSLENDPIVSFKIIGDQTSDTIQDWDTYALAA